MVTAMLLDTQKTEDFVQQAFVNAYRHVDRYEPGRDFGRWLTRAALSTNARAKSNFLSIKKQTAKEIGESSTGLVQQRIALSLLRSAQSANAMLGG